MTRRPDPQRTFIFRVPVLENALPILDELAGTGFHGDGTRRGAAASLVRDGCIEAWNERAKRKGKDAS